jgi:hypothetical protein
VSCSHVVPVSLPPVFLVPGSAQFFPFLRYSFLFVRHAKIGDLSLFVP